MKWGNLDYAFQTVVHNGGIGDVEHLVEGVEVGEQGRAFDIGFEEYLFSGDWCFIEWAERVEKYLPEPAKIGRASCRERV